MIKFYTPLIAGLLLITSVEAQRTAKPMQNARPLPASKLTTLLNRTNAGCDTINYPVPSTWHLTIYSAGANNDGILSGTNSFNDQEKAAYFDASGTPDLYMTKVFIYFAYANSNVTANLDKVVPIKVYNGDINTLPTTLITTVNKTLAQIKADVQAKRFTEVVFPTPISLPASKKFYVSVDLSNLVWDNSNTAAPKDTLGIVSTTNGDTYADDNGFFVEKYEDGTWHTGIESWNVDVNLAIFPVLGTTPDCGSLPITLSSFSGERVAAKNLLKWVTQTEINNKGFEIQRSADGINFTTVGYINSHGANGSSTTSLAYNFEDVKPFNGSSYYRLKQVDKDGRFSLSAIVMIKGSKATGLQLGAVYPNPVRGSLNMMLTVPVTGKINVIVTDLAGRVMMQQTTQTVQGDNNIPINVSRLAPGSYVLKIISATAGQTVSATFVKQ